MKHPAMCPQCGWLFDHRFGLVPVHQAVDTWTGQDDPLYSKVVECPGSEQNPRNPLSDRRLLWSGKPSPHGWCPTCRSQCFVLLGCCRGCGHKIDHHPLHAGQEVKPNE